MKILITGVAGFIGFHLSNALLSEGHIVIGIDNLNDYYDVELKFARLSENGIDKNLIKEKSVIKSNFYENFSFVKVDISDYDYVVDFFIKNNFDCVINLAAQAGVRYSLENPRIYLKSNVDGFLSILEGCRYSSVKHLIYASTSSVYGLDTKMPLNENFPTEHPMSLYAATKKSNELMAHTYSHLFNISTTGLRFFTVYGPWGRPDMALFLFTKSILAKEPIKVFNHGNMVRDFTYVKDIVESIKRLLDRRSTSNLDWDGNNPLISSSSAPYRIFNIGNSSPTPLMNYINALEQSLKIDAIIQYEKMQPGDVPYTHADVSSLENYIDFRPNTKVEDGINDFVKWYKRYYLSNCIGKNNIIF